jgi:hypothetical protein
MTLEDARRVHPGAKLTREKRAAKHLGTDDAWLLWRKKGHPPGRMYSLYLHLGINESTGTIVVVQGPPMDHSLTLSDEELLTQFVERFGMPTSTAPVETTTSRGWRAKDEERGQDHHWFFEDCDSYLRLTLTEVDSTFPSPRTFWEPLHIDYRVQTATLGTLAVFERLYGAESQEAIDRQ